MSAETRTPEAVALDAMLAEVIALLRRFVIVTDPQAVALALWVVHTYVVEAAHATPYLAVRSAEPRSGKTRLLELLELVVCRPWKVSSTSEAALFRKLAQSKPTLLLDEIDAVFSGVKSERNESLRAILNSGNRPGACVARCIGEGSRQTVVDFEVYSPKVLAGLNRGTLPDTISDRSLTIELKRKTRTEKVERFRFRDVNRETEMIRSALALWATTEGLADRLRRANPELPDSLHDRAAEAAEPLLALADEAGKDWPKRARRAVVELAGGQGEVEALGTTALRIIAETLGDRDKVPTAEIVTALNADESAAFGAWHDGRGIDGRGLARLLAPYGVEPKGLRIGGKTPRGYERQDALDDAFERYLEPNSRNSATNRASAGNSDMIDPQRRPGRVAGENGQKPRTEPQRCAVAANEHDDDADELERLGFTVQSESDLVGHAVAKHGKTKGKK